MKFYEEIVWNNQQVLWDDPKNLLPYSGPTICQKCGYNIVDSIYAAPSPLGDCYDIWYDPREHILRRCQRCFYTWKEAALEKSGE